MFLYFPDRTTWKFEDIRHKKDQLDADLEVLRASLNDLKHTLNDHGEKLENLIPAANDWSEKSLSLRERFDTMFKKVGSVLGTTSQSTAAATTYAWSKIGA